VSGLSRDEVGRGVRALAAELLPSAQRAAAAGLADDVALSGAGGLGFDSVRLVELVFACEERFGVTIPADLLERGSLEIGALVDAIVGARVAAR